MVITTRNLSKTYGETQAVKGVSLSVEQGNVYGFIGLNGAGKTTLIRMMLGMIKPTNGSVYLMGEEVNSNFRHWQNIGYLVETPYAYPQLTVYENLRVYFLLRGLSDASLIDEVITRLKLDPYKLIKAGVLSLGNQQRLGIAKAMIHKPRILVLDEPINGLDPEGIAEVRGLLRELAGSGVTVFLSSHILGEVSRIADKIGIIHKGSLIKELSKTELENSLNKKLIVDTKDNSVTKAILNANGYAAIINDKGELELSEPKATVSPEQITELLCNNTIYPTKILPFIEDLEAFFLRTIKV